MMRPMSKTDTCPRRRNIIWSVNIDQLAVDLAHERRCKGGVSELLARLVAAEAKRKVGILRKPRGARVTG